MVEKFLDWLLMIAATMAVVFLLVAIWSVSCAAGTNCTTIYQCDDWGTCIATTSCN